MSTSEERIILTDLSNEMSRSYLEYAMSVIVGRALPDARDGLKPVHRRILYAMYELGLTADRPFRKCARVVGEVLGKYHPHGDTAVYDALVRMAQDFSMRSPLIDGHGNFGSVDNDPPAAMRYTESRLRPIAQDGLLQDIESETVDFIDNFDGSQQEPVVLPASLPQLLLNGSSGIAVGMATNIPPHNLGELINGLVALIHNPEITDAELMRYIPAPDFPTGGQILGNAGIREVYTTGRGSITMRGVAAIETLEYSGRPDRDAIIITELPFQTNKAAMIERIAEMVNDKKLEGIADIRDESDRDGMRIVIELKRDAYPQVVLNNLYKQTPLQSNFSANMLALVDGEPRILTLKDFLNVFLTFRIETITRRTQYLLRKAEERDHLLQGLLIALANLDPIIQLIRGAADTPTAKQALIDSFELSETQADAILQMQLRRLTALEAEKIQQEHEELQVRIADYRDILARRERILGIIQTELENLRERFADDRRTELLQTNGSLETIDLIANECALILLTEQGYIKRMPVDTFEAQNRATRGKAGTRMKEDDVIEHFLTCCDHDRILLFSDRGVVYTLPAYQIPASSRNARGVPIVQILPIPREERITSLVPVSEFTNDEYLLMLTQRGYIKKTTLAAFSNIRSNGLIAICLEDGDQLRWVRRVRVEDSILIGSRKGMTIHFRANHEQLRPLGRATRGVRAMSLREGDSLISMDVLPAQIVAQLSEVDVETDSDHALVDVIATRVENESTTWVENESTTLSEAIGNGSGEDEVAVQSQGPWMLVITAKGQGKRVPVSQFRLQKRAGLGLRAIKFRSDEDELVALWVVHLGQELMVVTNRGIIIRQAADDIPQQSRSATGVRVQRLDQDDAIAAVALVPTIESTENSEVLEGENLEGESLEGESLEGESLEGESLEEESLDQESLDQESLAGEGSDDGEGDAIEAAEDGGDSDEWA